MVKPTAGQGKDTTTDRPADASRAPFADPLALNPLLAQSAAAMAAATAVGLTMTSHFAGAFFGVLQGAMEATNRPDRTAAPQRTAAGKTEAPAAAVQPQEVPAAAPVQPARRKPVRRKAQAGDPKLASAEKAAASVEKAPASVKKAPVRRATAAKAAATRTAAAKPAGRRLSADGVADLKRISGIGPKLEKMLNGMGVERLSQIAAWSDEDVSKFDEALGLDGRIGRDDWVGQAGKLAE